MSLLKDGFQTIVTFSGAPNLKLYETEVTPPGIQIGGGIDQTTMRNEEYRTKAAKALKEMTEGSYKAAYDPNVYQEAGAILGVNMLIKITFPDDSELEFWGFLDALTPNGLSEGNRPLADVKIVPTLMNDNDEEVPPAWSA